jgi:hypothetical protein
LKKQHLKSLDSCFSSTTRNRPLIAVAYQYIHNHVHHTYPQHCSRRCTSSPSLVSQHITNAFIQGSGQVGSHILTSLLATNNHAITALSRADSTATFPSTVTVKKVDYALEESITTALQNIDFLIICLNARAPPDVHPRIVAAAASAGVKYVLPNYYGFGLDERSGSLDKDAIGKSFMRFINDVKAADVKWVALCCGFWYEFSLGMGEPWFGFDIKARKVTMMDKGTTKINTSTWRLCGDAVAALVSLPASEFSAFENNGMYVASFMVSQRDMLDSLHRVLGTSDEDWGITYQPVEERYKEGLKELEEGNMVGFAKALYSRTFFPGGRGDYETGYGLDNAKLGLQKEELDEATKRAVKMVEEGFGYKG